jgi:hypothetical protein
MPAQLQHNSSNCSGKGRVGKEQSQHHYLSIVMALAGARMCMSRAIEDAGMMPYWSTTHQVLQTHACTSSEVVGSIVIISFQM